MSGKKILLSAVLWPAIAFLIPLFPLAGGRGYSVNAQGGAYNLAEIPVPYNFKTFQALSTLESFTVGGDGDFLFVDLWSGAEFRTKVGDFDLFGVYFISPKLGWVVGERGKIYRTDDGGRTWLEQKSNVNSDLKSIACKPTLQCWVVGENGIVLRSTDGFSWKILDSGTDKILFAADFLDLNNGLAVGEDSTIIKTTDGGLTWKRSKVKTDTGKCEQKGTSSQNPISHLYAVTFIDKNKALVGGLYGIGRTVAGGLNWRVQCIDDGPIEGITTGSDGTAFAIVPYGYNLISKDSGRTWVKQSKE